MGTCRRNPIGLSNQGVRRMNDNIWSLPSEPTVNCTSESYGKVEEYHNRLMDALVSGGIDDVDMKGRGKREASSPCLDDIPSEDGIQTVSAEPIDENISKKKLKRFRLTHNQTRYLMNEFTRQAHPDAAHRERLSREIPGLSPRQVQVWFQNRRAKLKRLSTDDRERMLKSRTVPEDFDMAKALRWPYATYPKVSTTPNLSGNFDHSVEQKETPVVIESIKFSREELLSATAANHSPYGYYTSTPLSMPEVNTEPDDMPSNPSLTERRMPFMSWNYSQMPTPPLEPTSLSETGSSADSTSSSSRAWIGVTSVTNATTTAPIKCTPPSLTCNVNSPLTPAMSYCEKPIHTPLLARSFSDRSGLRSEDFVPATRNSSISPHSASSEGQLFQVNPCFSLSSFDITCPPGTSLSMGFTNPGIALNQRFGEMVYPIDTGRNIWSIAP